MRQCENRRRHDHYRKLALALAVKPKRGLIVRRPEVISRMSVALLHGGFERRDGAVVESFTQRIRNWLARVFAFG